jgi:hypothetical protein
MYVIVAECGAARQIVEENLEHIVARVHASDRQRACNCSLINFTVMHEDRAQKLKIPHQG